MTSGVTSQALWDSLNIALLMYVVASLVLYRAEEISQDASKRSRRNVWESRSRWDQVSYARVVALGGHEELARRMERTCLQKFVIVHFTFRLESFINALPLYRPIPLAAPTTVNHPSKSSTNRRRKLSNRPRSKVSRFSLSRGIRLRGPLLTLALRRRNSRRRCRHAPARILRRDYRER